MDLYKYIGTNPEKPYQTLGHSMSVAQVGEESLAKRLLGYIHSNHIELHSHGRFAKYLAILDNPSSTKMDRCIAETECFQILNAFAGIKDIGEWKSTFETALNNDAIAPTQFPKFGPGRDAQFELYVAGRLGTIGVKYLKLEPDIICQIEAHEFSVAAKRVQSIKQIQKRVREARDQIETSQKKGIIVLELSSIFTSQFHALSASDLPIIVQNSMNILTKEISPHVDSLSRINPKSVIGMVAFCTMSNYLPEPDNFISTIPLHHGNPVFRRGDNEAKYIWDYLGQLGGNVII